MILFLGEGAFGSATGAALAKICPVKRLPFLASQSELKSVIAEASFVAVGLWRRYDREMFALEEACGEARVPWSSAVLADRYVWCGPQVSPGGEGCYRCFIRRVRVQEGRSSVQTTLAEAYERDPTLGAPGFPPFAASLAAAALNEDAQRPVQRAGRVRRVDLLTGDLEESAVLAVHGCQRCFPVETEDGVGERFVKRLRAWLGDFTDEQRTGS